MKFLQKTIALLIMIITVLAVTTNWVAGPEPVVLTNFEIKENTVLIAEKDGTITVNMDISPADADISDFELASDNTDIATATLAAIDTKNEDDKDADAINTSHTAIITANDWGECEITATLGGISDTVNVIVANKRIALTFDDGACEHTFKLLDGLKKKRVDVTFFVVGGMTKKANHMEALKRAIKDGHEIGNHTYSHKAGANTLEMELSKTDKLIKKVGGEETTIMRPPGGAVNDGTQKSGKAIILWSFDTLDWKYRNAKAIKTNLVKNAEDNDIVLLHDLHQTSVEGALKAINPLKKKGFMFVTVSDIIGDPEPNKIYRKGNGKLETQVIK